MTIIEQAISVELGKLDGNTSLSSASSKHKNSRQKLNLTANSFLATTWHDDADHQM